MPTARHLDLSQGALREELERLGADATTQARVLAQEHRASIALSGLGSDALGALRGACRLHKLRLIPHRSDETQALVLGPELLLSEVAKDLPPDLSQTLRSALRRADAAEARRSPGTAAALRHARGVLDLTRPQILGIVNATPDSFSDGGLYADAAEAIARGLELLAEGAAAIDVGGESTRPGAAEVPLEEELGRTVPVVEALAARGALVSIDTRKPRVAQAAIAAGAAIVNDVSGLRDERMREVVAATGAGAIVMHMQGEPQTMQASPSYREVVREVAEYLADQICAAKASGIAVDALAVDPGIGFGKTYEHNVALLRGLPVIERVCGRPVLVGASRKSFLKPLTQDAPPEGRLAASVAAALLAAQRGARLLRVHDVKATADALRVLDAFEGRPLA